MTKAGLKPVSGVGLAGRKFAKADGSADMRSRLLSPICQRFNDGFFGLDVLVTVVF